MGGANSRVAGCIRATCSHPEARTSGLTRAALTRSAHRAAARPRGSRADRGAGRRPRRATAGGRPAGRASRPGPDRGGRGCRGRAAPQGRPSHRLLHRPGRPGRARRTCAPGRLRGRARRARRRWWPGRRGPADMRADPARAGAGRRGRRGAAARAPAAGASAPPSPCPTRDHRAGGHGGARTVPGLADRHAGPGHLRRGPAVPGHGGRRALAAATRSTTSTRSRSPSTGTARAGAPATCSWWRPSTGASAARSSCATPCTPAAPACPWRPGTSASTRTASRAPAATAAASTWRPTPSASMGLAGRVPRPDSAVLDQAVAILTAEYASDPRVRAAADALTARLGLGLAGLINVVNPDRVLLGGLHRYLLEAAPDQLREAVAPAQPLGPRRRGPGPALRPGRRRPDRRRRASLAAGTRRPRDAAAPVTIPPS